MHACIHVAICISPFSRRLCATDRVALSLPVIERVSEGPPHVNAMCTYEGNMREARSSYKKKLLSSAWVGGGIVGVGHEAWASYVLPICGGCWAP